LYVALYHRNGRLVNKNVKTGDYPDTGWPINSPFG
jgi:hypothetical protein